ncbi:MAG: hypothetical protein NWE95_07005 [Candidatus Bathyarchaeota archaeon]|nr:hypothetical protein [Candidatus Bathyarchaeota archaeon]
MLVKEIENQLTQFYKKQEDFSIKIRTQPDLRIKRELMEEKGKVDLQIQELETKLNEEKSKENRRLREEKLKQAIKNNELRMETSRNEKIHPTIEVITPTAHGYTIKINLAETLTDTQVDRLLNHGENLQIPLQDFDQREAEIKRLQMMPFKTEQQKNRLNELKHGKFQSLLIIRKV